MKGAANIILGAVFTTLHFLYNLQRGPKSLSAKIHKAGKACQKDIAAYCAHKLRKSSLRMILGTVFTTLHFLHNLQRGPKSLSAKIHKVERLARKIL
jgi:hypothetical protein